MERPLADGSRERGASAVEYALMAMLIALVIFGTVTLIGTTLRTIFENATASI